MNRCLPVFIIPLLISCSVSKTYNPNKKYAAAELQQDYGLLRNILEEKHPSLYWYTFKDSMDYYFKKGQESITDSMTELQFGWKVVAPLLANIHCGHTSFRMSKGWNQFIKNRRIPSFPLELKVWNDTMMVVYNLNKKDSSIQRGNFVTAINGLKNQEIISTIFSYMTEDGYANNVNYNRLSMSFPYFHRNVFGLYPNYLVSFTDSNGVEKSTLLPFYAPAVDTTKGKSNKPKKNIKVTRKQSLENLRSVKYDSTSALMTINSFYKSHLKGFIRKSFRDLRKKKLDNLIIDLRYNGGGDIDNSVFLTRYLRNTDFKVADSVYSKSKNFAPFTRHISTGLLNNIALTFISRKKKDDNYHFGYWENHTYHPKGRNHFSGKVYILTNGLTFSASSLFCNTVKGQENILLAGEETGGGAYGNSGIMIPNITLPHTGLRVRLPFFRIVQYQHHNEDKGSGVVPDIYIGTNWRDILNRIDTKEKVVREMINGK